MQGSSAYSAEKIKICPKNQIREEQEKTDQIKFWSETNFEANIMIWFSNSFSILFGENCLSLLSKRLESSEQLCERNFESLNQFSNLVEKFSMKRM